MSSCQTGAAVSSGPTPADQENIGGILAMLGQVADFCKPRGKIYELHFVLAVAVIATLAGATSFREIGSHAPDIPQDLLARIGAPYSYFKQRFVAPSESIIRRVLEEIDAAALDLAVGAWLFQRATRDDNGDLVIALDGKVLRGAWTDENQ